MRITTIATILFLFFTPIKLTGKELYKWVDQDGNVHFGQIRPTGKAVEKIQVKAGGQGNRKEVLETNSAETDQDERQEEGKTQPDASVEKQPHNAEIRNQNCSRARQNLKILQDDHQNAAVSDKNGSPVKLSEEATAAKLKETRQLVKRYCE
ncbi:MAG: DUF4124 domain-containing protein [Gammaproteobacteria bacterium]|nr:DUF4124 domain-containing protein [Gammaproteobacteria bacterium]